METTTTITKTPAATAGKKSRKRVVKKAIKETVDTLAEDKRTRRLVKEQLKQHMPNFPPEIAQLSAALAMPKDYVVPRFGGSMGSDPTALANPWQRFDITYPSGVIPPEMTASEFVCFCFRDALRSTIFPTVITSPCAYSGGFLYRPTYSSESFPSYRDAGGAIPWQVGQKPHGPALYLGRIGPADQHRGILLSSTDNMIITMNDGSYAVGSTCYCIVKVLNAGIWTPVAEFSHLQGSGVVNFTFNPAETGYYALSFAYNSPGGVVGPTPGFIKLNIGANASSYPASVWCQQSLPKFSESYQFVDAIRITGASLMYTNTASPLNRQGQIVGLQVPKGSSWLQYTSFSDVSIDKKSVTRDIVNGAYGFLKPTSTDDLELKIYELPSDTSQLGQFEDCVFTLYPESDFLVLIGSCNVPAGQVGYVTLAYAAEYTTLSQWIDVRLGKLTDGEIKTALEVLSTIPQWHENALHWDDIWNWVKDTAKSVWSGIKEIAPVAAAVAPLVL